MTKTLVVYYSMQGNTKKVAEMIAQKTGADTARLELVKEYSLVTSLTKGLAHIKKGVAPELKPVKLDLNKYDQIYIGTPVWWYTFTPPIRSFFEQFDLDGKILRFFCTHGGNTGTTFDDLEKLAGTIKMLAPKDFFTKRKCDWKKIEVEVEGWIN